MATVRCKVHCREITKQEHWDHAKRKAGVNLFQAKFHFVTDGSPENDRFFAATPGGILDIQTTERDVFVVGQDYYLDLTPAE